MNDIKKLAECLESSGIYIDLDNCYTNNDTDIDIRDFVTSSIQFITVIVSIEEAFNIEFPDEYLTIDLFSSMKNLISIIDGLQECK